MSTDDLERMRAKMRALTGRSGNTAKRGAAPDTSLRTVQTKRERSRAARGSKTKGSSYERKVAKKVGAWCGDTLRRTPQSGGWSGGSAHGVSGDLVCDRPKHPFHWECKKREGWTLDDLILGVRVSLSDTRSILGWWSQTVRTCPTGKYPMLVFARNRVPDMLMMSLPDFEHVTRKDFTAGFLPHYVFHNPDASVPLVVIAFDDFLAKVPPPKGCKNYRHWVADPKALDRARKIDDNAAEGA